MLAKKSHGDIKLFYKMAKRRKGNNEKELALAFSTYIENTGKKINDEVKDAIGNMTRNRLIVRIHQEIP